PNPEVAIPVIGEIDLQRCCATADEGAAWIDARSIGGGAQSSMQNRRVRRVDAAFERLQPVAFLDDLRDMAMARGHTRELEARRWRGFLDRAEIRPDNAARLDRRIVLDAHLIGEAIVAGLVHLLDAVAV